MKNRNTIIELINSLLIFILGFLITFSALNTIENLWLVFIIIFITSGAILLYNFFDNKEYKTKDFLNLFIASINIYLALFTLTNFESFRTNIPSLISLYALISGLSFIIKYYLVKKDKDQNQILAITSFIIAIILILKPITLATIYIKLSGLYLITLSLYYLITNMQKITKKRK